MGLFSRRKKIQASEGKRSNVDILSGITFFRSAEDIPGTSNAYLTYDTQVDETFRKYNGRSEYGNSCVRTIIDTRTSFIAGEGLSVFSNDENSLNWIYKFLRINKLNGSIFYKIVMETEMTGVSILILEAKPTEIPVIKRLPRKINYEIGINGDLIVKLNNGKETVINKDKYVIIKTGGDCDDTSEATTKIGLVLADCENYERALRDIRRTNYTSSRITPTFKTQSDEETKALAKELANKGWKIGQAVVGKAEFSYQSAQTSALENFKTELASTAKNISSTTGIPVHWLGWTDLMSNRATAEDLYQMISNATSRERTIISEAFSELIEKAQTLYIDNGGTEIYYVDREITVTIPSIDYGRFESLVRALSVAYNDGIITEDDYRGFIPGIDPIRTKKQLESKKEITNEIDNLLTEEEEKEEVI